MYLKAKEVGSTQSKEKPKVITQLKINKLNRGYCFQHPDRIVLKSFHIIKAASSLFKVYLLLHSNPPLSVMEGRRNIRT